jgi:hypothetical protein
LRTAARRWIGRGFSSLIRRRDSHLDCHREEQRQRDSDAGACATVAASPALLAKAGSLRNSRTVSFLIYVIDAVKLCQW